MLKRTGGLLLAGGGSRRFGSEKAVALFRGRVLMDVVAAKFASCAAFAVSARADTEAARYARARGFDVVGDNPADPSGPLAGISAGFAWAEAQGLGLLATAPCDAPCLPEDLIIRLIERMGGASAAFAATVNGEHPLCAVWRLDLHAPLRNTLNAGVHPPVRAFLGAHGARRVLFGDADAFANANTAVELERLERGACHGF